MKFIELFAGIGGFRYGLERVCLTDKIQEMPRVGDKEGQCGEQPNPSAKRLYDCVWANEIDKYACQIYRRNYGHKFCKGLGESEERNGEPKTSIKSIRACEQSTQRQGDKPISQGRQEELHCPELYEGDITKVKSEEIPGHDLLVGGFPCQAFSIAGKRGGFEDTRGTLFFEIARIAQEKRPRLLLLENVKGLLSHDKGRTFGAILTTLDEIGYDCQWQVLNSKNFGVPQNRERVFIIGHLRGTGRPEVFPIGEDDHLLAGEDKTDKGRTQTEYSTTLRGGNTKADHTFISSIRATEYKHGDNQTTIAENGMKIRRLTPTECERLQGFPDGWTEYGIDNSIYKNCGICKDCNEVDYDKIYSGEQKIVPISDTQRYKCLGNAVTTNVITEIGKRL